MSDFLVVQIQSQLGPLLLKPQQAFPRSATNKYAYNSGKKISPTGEGWLGVDLQLQVTIPAQFLFKAATLSSSYHTGHAHFLPQLQKTVGVNCVQPVINCNPVNQLVCIFRIEDLAQSYLKILLCAPLVFLLTCIIFFNSWCNLLAEVTRFGDREFYQVMELSYNYNTLSCAIPHRAGGQLLVTPSFTESGTQSYTTFSVLTFTKSSLQ